MEIVIRKYEMWLELGSKAQAGKRSGRPLHRADVGSLRTGGEWRARRDSLAA